MKSNISFLINAGILYIISFASAIAAVVCAGIILFNREHIIPQNLISAIILFLCCAKIACNMANKLTKEMMELGKEQTKEKTK